MEAKKEVDVFKISEKLSDKNQEREESSDGDYIKETIGAVGFWQVGVCTAAVLTRYVALGNMTSVVFLTPLTDFICTDIEDNFTIVQNNTCYKTCSKYDFHSEVMETTLISDFGLICDKAWLKSFVQTVMMFGLVVGTSLFGWISDRFGRRVAIISSSLLNVICTISTSFAPDYWTFNILRFAAGIASGGSLIICVTIIMEIVSKKYREAAGAFCIIPDGISEASLALFAYFLPQWNTYLLGFGVTCIIILFFVCFVPESPRWLISNGKIDEAVKVMIRAAELNHMTTSHIRDIVTKRAEEMKIKENEKVTLHYSDFFRTKHLSIVTITTLVIWTIVGITYYGIYQYMTLLNVNVFMTVAILGLIQLPLFPIQIIINRIWSRKASLIGTVLVTCFTMIILIFTPKEHWTTTLFGVIGFCASSITFGVLYVYTAELYPTPLRTMAYGLSSSAAKLGSMVAPFIANMTPVWIPSSIFAATSLIAAMSCYALPETKGNNLKDTVES